MHITDLLSQYRHIRLSHLILRSSKLFFVDDSNSDTLGPLFETLILYLILQLYLLLTSLDNQVIPKEYVIICGRFSVHH